MSKEIFTCNCKDKPYCDCGRLNLERILLNLRIEDGLSIGEMSTFFEEEYKILIFKGDIIDYLENLIYSFESFLNISKGITIDPSYQEELNEIPKLIQKIKNKPF